MQILLGRPGKAAAPLSFSHLRVPSPHLLVPSGLVTCHLHSVVAVSRPVPVSDAGQTGL